VRARCHSDDFEHETSFIASSWFTQASDSEILALAATNWEHAYEADAVARHCEDDEPDLIALFKYTDNNDMGFECEVDAASASAWVRTHRPHLDLTSGQRP
jgi:hypothetical protein